MRPIEHQFPFFAVANFGNFPLTKHMQIEDYLRAVYGRGEYNVADDFKSDYGWRKMGIIIHVKAGSSNEEDPLWDYFFIAGSLKKAMAMLEERWPLEDESRRH